MNQEKIKQIIELLLKQENAELVDLKLSAQGQGGALKVLVEKEGGITLGMCAKLNRKISNVFKADGLNDNYLIEVSSPGLDRPLRQLRDFRGALGKTVMFKIRGREGKDKEFIAVIKKIENNSIIEVETKDNKFLKLDINDVVNANLKIRW